MIALIKNIHQTYFDKHKPLRHYTQHLFVGIAGFAIISLLWKTPVTSSNVLIFLIFTYLIDLDGLSWFFLNWNHPISKEIQKALVKGNFYQVGVLVTTYHKTFNTLLIHNVFGLVIFIGLFVYMLSHYYIPGIMAVGAIFSHFTFDFLDDIYQMGHVNNWMKPIRSILNMFNSRVTKA